MLSLPLRFVKGRGHNEGCTEAYQLGVAVSETPQAFEEGGLAVVSC
jgi:hypothetical protein